MKDIESRLDIEQLVNTFYNTVKQDNKIGYLFTEIAKVNWEHHLPKMYDFWESVILEKNLYSGNPITAHSLLNTKETLTYEHFNHWVYLFLQNLDLQFKGPNAEKARQRAQSIATVMQIKVINQTA